MLLRKLSLRTRLIMLTAVPLFLLLVLGVIVMSAVKSENDRLVRNVFDTSYHAGSALLNAERDLLQAKDALRQMIALDRQSAAYYAQAALLRSRLAEAEANLAEAGRISAGSSGFTRLELTAVSGRINEAAAAALDWRNAVMAVAGPLLPGKGAGTRPNRLEMEYRLEGMEPLFDKARKQVDEARRHLDEAVHGTVERSQSRTKDVFRFAGAFLLLAAGALTAFGAAIIRSVQLSLSDVVGLASAAALVEAHSERSRVDRDRNQEDLAELGATIGHMSDNLDRLVASVRLITPPVVAAGLPADADNAVDGSAAGPRRDRPAKGALPRGDASLSPER